MNKLFVSFFASGLCAVLAPLSLFAAPRGPAPTATPIPSPTLTPLPTPTPCPCPCTGEVDKVAGNPTPIPETNEGCGTPMARPTEKADAKAAKDGKQINAQFLMVCYDPADQSIDFGWQCRHAEDQEHFEDWLELVCSLVGCEKINEGGCKGCCIDKILIDGEEWPVTDGCPATPTPSNTDAGRPPG